MSTSSPLSRTRWAAIGAAVAICLGAGSIGVVDAVKSSGERSIYTAIASCRVTDTRPAADLNVGPKSSPLGPGEIMTVKVTGDNGRCSGVPSDITGVSLNVTTLHATENTHITIWPDGPVPDASSLNPAPGTAPAPNAVTTKVAGDGTFKVFNFQGSVNVVIDIVGYFQDHHHDDRYPTDAEAKQYAANAVASAPWSISVPVSQSHGIGSSVDWQIAHGASTGPGGLRLDGGAEYSRFWNGFTVPPQHSTGDAIRLRFTWAADENEPSPCAYLFELNWLDVTRPGTTNVVVSAEFESPHGFGSPATLLQRPGNLAEIQGSYLELSGDLQPGDHVQFAFNRDADDAPDTCSEALYLTGMTAEPG